MRRGHFDLLRHYPHTVLKVGDKSVPVLELGLKFGNLCGVNSNLIDICALAHILTELATLTHTYLFTAELGGWIGPPPPHPTPTPTPIMHPIPVLASPIWQVPGILLKGDGG